MKRILILFLLIIGVYIVFTKVDYSTWLPFTKHTTEASVSSSTETIDIDINGVGTAIIPEKRNNLQAELNGKGTVTVEEKGNSISVTYRRNWFDWFPFFDQPKLTIYIPEDYKQNMSIRAGSGALDFSSPSETPMKLNRLNVEMGSGSLKINNLNAEAGTFNVSSGRVSVNHFSGKLNGTVSSGIFAAQLDELKGSIDVEVSSGMAKLDLPNNANFTLDGRVSSGIISNQFPLKNQLEDKKHLQGIHGSGKYDVNLTVSSGTITIN